MNKRLLLSILSIFYLSLSYAQMGYGKLEDIKEVKEKTLLVILDEKSDKLLKKIGKNPEKFTKYATIIDEYNIALREAFNTTWTFSESIEYITKSEFEAIKKDKSRKDKYAYFSNKINRSPGMFSSSSRAGDPSTYSMNLGLTKKKKPVYLMMFTSMYPNTAELTTMIQQFQNYLKLRVEYKTGKKSKKELKAEMKKNAHLLKDKTLLFDENTISKKLKSQINKIYKYKYKFTNKEEIDKIILSKDSNYAYVRAFPIMQQSGGKSSGIKFSKLIFYQAVLDAENGIILAMSRPAAAGLGGNIGVLTKSSNKITTIKDLEKFIKNIE